MATVAIGFLLILLAMAGLALGVMAGRPPLKGSCGGVAGEGCACCTRRCRGRRE